MFFFLLASSFWHPFKTFFASRKVCLWKVFCVLGRFFSPQEIGESMLFFLFHQGDHERTYVTVGTPLECSVASMQESCDSTSGKQPKTLGKRSQSKEEGCSFHLCSICKQWFACMGHQMAHLRSYCWISPQKGKSMVWPRARYSSSTNALR